MKKVLQTTGLHLIIAFLFMSPAIAGELLQERLLRQCTTGNPNLVANSCRQYVRQSMDGMQLNEASMKKILDNGNLSQTCYMYLFFSDIKWKGTLVMEELGDREFSRWLLNNPRIFEDLVFANRPHRNTLAVLYRIWLMEGKQLSGLPLRMALGAALVANGFEPDMCLAKYAFYKKSLADGQLFPQFSMLEPWEFALLFGGRESTEDLAWGQKHLAGKKNITADNAGGAVCWLIPYRNRNKDGVSVHAGGAFYDHKPITLQIYTEYGGVCGAVSKGACGFLRAKGIPCYTIGQPGHCAFIWKRKDGSWAIGNNIYGWNWSQGDPGLPWPGPVPTILSIFRFKAGGNVPQSNLCYSLSKLSRKPGNAEFLLQYSFALNPGNLPARKTYLALKARQWGEEEKKEQAMKVREAMQDDPYALECIIDSILRFNWKKTDAYSVYPMLLTESESQDSIEIYMRHFRSLAANDIPDLKGALTYDAKTRHTFFKMWEQYVRKNRIPQKTKIRMCTVLEKAIGGLVAHEKTAGRFLDFYGQLLEIWKDDKLVGKARSFLEQQLEKTGNPAMVKHLLNFGIRLGNLSNNVKMIGSYAEKLERLKHNPGQ